MCFCGTDRRATWAWTGSKYLWGSRSSRTASKWRGWSSSGTRASTCRCSRCWRKANSSGVTSRPLGKISTSRIWAPRPKTGCSWSKGSRPSALSCLPITPLSCNPTASISNAANPANPCNAANVSIISTDDSRAVLKAGLFNLNFPRCALLFDGHCIIDAERLTFTLADDSADLSKERLTFGLQVILFSIHLIDWLFWIREKKIKKREKRKKKILKKKKS